MAGIFTPDILKVAQAAGHNLQEFTPAEQACISSTISKGVDDGKPMDQAIAIAISECAPSKVEASADLTDISDIPGGRYTAIDNGDGTFDILDVPIVAELKKGEKNTPFDIGRQWHLMALVTNQRREAEGHMAPLKIHHPELGANRPERAGFLSLTRVGTVRMNGETMSALFARFRRVTAEAFLRIQNVELPYRSVEANWSAFEIDAVALLDSEVPFHRMEMLTIGQVEKASVSALRENKFALAYCALGNEPGRGAALFNLGLIPVGVKTMAEAKKDAKGKLDKHEDDEDKDKPKSMEDRVDSLEQGMNALNEGMGTMQTSLQEIVKRLPEKKDEDDKDDEDEAVARAAASDDAAPVEALATDPKTAATLAAQNIKISRMEKERATEKLMTKAVDEDLVGYTLDEKSMAMLTACANQGEKAVAQFVEVIKANVEPETPKDEAALEMENAVSSMSTEAQDFCKAEGGSDEVKADVATAEAAYKLFKEHTGTKLSLKNWLESKKFKAELTA